MNNRFKILLLAITPLLVQGQERHDKGKFINYENTYWKEIKSNVDLFNTPKPEVKQTFKMDFSSIDVPKSADEFHTVWAGKPVSQGATNTCWSFSTSSFYESEVKRITGQEVRLSEQYIVYWEYVEKAKEYVRTRGTSAFGEGSETNAVARMMKHYGMVPYESFTGYRMGQKFLDHAVMFAEMDKYLKWVKDNGAWNEEEIVGTIRSIMEHYMGKVPDSVTINGKKMSPQDYTKNILKLNPDDYVDFMSLMEKPYWNQVEYDVNDNWWNSDIYFNVPLDDFMSIFKSALKSGYSIAIGGDNSESGVMGSKGVAMIPTYDIPSAYIDESARQLRFTNGSTTDDHAMHMVGWLEKPNGTWYLIKDSGSGGHNNPVSEGYYYFHEDYVKLKMMTITIHKDAVKDLLSKFPARRYNN